MKAFIKENSTLALGLGLPLLLVLLLWLSTVWVQSTTPPPQHDLLFATDYYNYNSGMVFKVENGKFKAVFIGKGNTGHPKLYRYHAKSDEVKEITYSVPEELTKMPQGGQIYEGETVISIPETEGLKLDAKGESPDGFTFGSDYRGRPLFSELFFSGDSRYRNAVMLSKGSYRKALPMKDAYGLGYNNQFIGWIIP